MRRTDTVGVAPAGLTTPPEPVVWDIAGAELVPLARWGRDHWSTLAYVETRAVDHRGLLNHDQMRVDAARHPQFAVARRRATVTDTRYPTRLKTTTATEDGRWGVVDLPDHDDYDCLNDAIRLGLVEVVMPTVDVAGDRFVDVHGRTVTHGDGYAIRPSFTTGLDEGRLMAMASFQLTETGQAVVAQLRAHLAAGRGSHQFMPSEPATGDTATDRG